jgi:hypothetical protein
MKTILLISLVVILSGCALSKVEMAVTVQNPSSFNRNYEMAEVEWKEIQQKLNLQSGENIIITNNSNEQIPYQIVLNDDNNGENILFLTSVEAGKEEIYSISKGQPDTFQPLVYGRLVPERKDDFTWENNRSAFRIYGPALKATGEISNGMDYWSKKTEELIIDKWYENDLAKVASYHADHGEGLDFYKVGRTLGLGMTAPLDNDTLCLGHNFVTAEIIDNGPLRITVKFTYDPYLAGDQEIIETRIISLDAYSFFNKITNVFEADTTLLTVATGIVMPVDNPEIIAETTTFGDNAGIIAYETPEDKQNGTIFTAAIHPEGFGEIKVSNGHFIGINSYQPGQQYTYYAGGGWSKAGFDNFNSWQEFVKLQKNKIDNPLIVKVN